MLFQSVIVSSLFVAVVLANAQPAPYRIYAGVSKNELFGVVRRQANPTLSGYAPTQTPCTGPGQACSSACGAGYEQCPSDDDDTHCFSPPNGDTCCPDLSGNSCSKGYFCTTDSEGGTWCCPNGLSLEACAAIYSLSATLISETGSATIAAASSSFAAATSTGTSIVSAATSTSSSAATVPPFSLGTATGSIAVPSSNATQSLPSTTKASPPKFTGAANMRAAMEGLPVVLALAVAGVVALL